MCSPAGRLFCTLGFSVITRRAAVKSGPAWDPPAPGFLALRPRSGVPARTAARRRPRSALNFSSASRGWGYGRPPVSAEAPCRYSRLVASQPSARPSHCGHSHAIAAGDPDAGLPRVSARAVTGRRRCRRSAPRLRPWLAVATAAPPLACSQVCDVVCETWDFPAECASRQEGPVLAVAASLTCWVLRRRKNHGAALSRGCCLVHPDTPKLPCPDPHCHHALP